MTCVLLAVSAAAEPLGFRVRLDPSVADHPVDGRLFVFLSRRARPQPRLGPNWFRPEPFFGRDVKHFAPGQTRAVDDSADGFPQRLSRWPPGKYHVQAVLAHSLDSPQPGRGEGNFYGPVASLSLDPAGSGTVELVLDRVVGPRPPPKSDWQVEVKLPSRLLSRFHGRQVIEPAMVILPPSYHHRPEKRYPVVYIIGGFGSDHRGGLWRILTGPREPRPGEVELIRVMLDGQCAWGHHVYANSATNGPRGDALVKEMIPYIDGHFRTVAASYGRFITGHSSGGWASLWLQVAYPDTFGGVWSFAPDPVDFRDFQRIDLYADPPQNMFRDGRGRRRPIARRGSAPVLWYDDFCRMDDCLGRGGQLRSFEAVFSPLGPDGLPRRLWNRRTGAIDPEVARAWRKYDIRLRLEENWDELGPKLRGKLHVIAAGQDTFYLEGAVRLLANTLKRLGSDAQIEIVPGANHGSVLSSERVAAVRRQISASYRRHAGPAAVPESL